MMDHEAAERSRIRAAVREPTVPPELVERTVVRGMAIQLGRRAEEQMVSAPVEGETKLRLAAQSVLGRLMFSTKAPVGVGYERMVDALLRDERFRSAANKPPGELLADIRSGRLTNSMRATHPTGKQAGENVKRAPDRTPKQSDPGSRTL